MSEYMTRRRAVAAIVLMAALAWLLWPDNQLVRVQAMQRELAGEAGRALSPEARQEKRQELRAAMDKLSPAQKDALGAEGRERMQGELAKYFAMSPAEKKSYLDKQIDRTQQFQTAMAKGKAPTPSTGGTSNGGGGPGGAKGPSTPEDRERHRQQRLDHTTPEFRAQTDIFRRDLEQRRRERGLAPAPSRGR